MTPSPPIPQGPIVKERPEVMPTRVRVPAHLRSVDPDTLTTVRKAMIPALPDGLLPVALVTALAGLLRHLRASR